MTTQPPAHQAMPKLLLAPMEGVTDWAMRDLLTGLGGIDQCVTEFLRVTDNLHGDAIFFKNCPELLTGGRTASGVPVFIQLLGGKVEPLVANALRAQQLGAPGVDLNFGCPAPTVNRHDGGATLLKYTDRLYNIVSSVRKALPAHIPVTAKIRLGFDDPSACLANTQAIESAGADWITVHCRTKTDGYRPPAHWEWIEKIKACTRIPIITNGEIWTLEDFNRCRSETDTHAYMIGRGALRDPFLFRKIKQQQQALTGDCDVKELLPKFYRTSSQHMNARFAVARTKGWLKQLAQGSETFAQAFAEIKTITVPEEFVEKLNSL
jgi:tRNA-dihydrouridine synthase C